MTVYIFDILSRMFFFKFVLKLTIINSESVNSISYNNSNIKDIKAVLSIKIQRKTRREWCTDLGRVDAAVGRPTTC